MKQRFLCIMLCLALLPALTSCSSAQSTVAISTPEPEATAEPTSGFTGDISEENVVEVELAKEVGLIPNDMVGDYSAPVTMDDMCEMALRAVELFYNMDVEPDLSVFSKVQLDPPVTRIEAAVVLTETVRAAIGEYPAYNGDPYRPEELYDFISADDSLIYNGTPSQIARVRVWGNPKDTVVVVSVLFATRQVDQITGKPLMELDADYNFNPKNTVSQLEAILAAFRLYRSLDPLPEYVSLEDVSTHTIDKSLYADESILPDASNQSLPAWRGMPYGPRSYSMAQAFGGANDTCYRKSSLQVIKDAGFNMVELYVSPTRFAWPYQLDDLYQVNNVELEMLDQAIAWAFELGLHVQLTFTDSPSLEGRFSLDAAWDYNSLSENSDRAQLFADTWRMIARRYADIPNRYLGFTLLNEVDPSSDEDYLRVFEPVIDAIWEESPDRLIIADVHSYNITGESMAKKGVALSRHQYAMPLLDYNLRGEDGGGLMDLYPNYIEELTWPIVYLPAMLHSAKNTITFTGDFKAGEITIGVNQIYAGGETLVVTMDGAKALSEEVIPQDVINGWGLKKVDHEYTISIPEGTKEISFYNQSKNRDGNIVFNRIKLTQTGQDDIILYPYDAVDSHWEPESVTIQVGANGSLDGNRVVTWDDLKSWGDSISYNSIKAMAEKYNVGFFVGEFGPFGKYGLPNSVMKGYIGMMLQGMKEDGVGWAYGSLEGKGQLMYNVPENDPENTYVPITDSPYYLNTNMLDFFKKYTSQN
ncbi:MAG: glycoside hydrolase family 5 protein [Clostridiales bacterium]|nr:glycoside hydrolase family 5 protein [Clostridiales bacterium]